MSHFVTVSCGQRLWLNVIFCQLSTWDKSQSLSIVIKLTVIKIFVCYAKKAFRWSKHDQCCANSDPKLNKIVLGETLHWPRGLHFWSRAHWQVLCHSLCHSCRNHGDCHNPSIPRNYHRRTQSLTHSLWCKKWRKTDKGSNFKGLSLLCFKAITLQQ